MELTDNVQIVCPIRGQLKIKKKSKDGLTPTEEFYRVEAIKYLLSKTYPKENFWIEPIIKRFGNSGRNSFRSDLAVLDTSVTEVDVKNPDELLNHALILCEIKRDNAKKDYVKETQVKPMLDFAKRQDTLGLYWDNIEKRVFWNEYIDGKKETKEGPLSFLPNYGLQIKTEPLTFATISPASSLIDVFSRIEDILHQASFSPEKRYEIILQLLLAKIFDEHAYEARQNLPLEIQDYRSLGTSDDVAKDKIDDVVKRAVSFYGKHLPNKISDKIPVPINSLLDILQILAPIKIIDSKRDVIQTFYMKFAKDLYKWDMAQYFTPTSVTDFLVDVINPQFGEHIADPACGSADFLVAAFRQVRQYNPGFADCVWGIDNSDNAVQIAVLNMLLNGDGKTNIIKDDTLEHIDRYLDKYDVVTCNPPFGTKILEKRAGVLRQYDLGYEWTSENGTYTKSDNLLKQQETGILFIEVCVKICKPGGRIAIILPNGYLGNRSDKYIAVRNWVLKNTRLAVIISLPRFTFKTSGADVSASVLYLEKREQPLEKLSDDSDYKFAIELIEKVGWDAGNRKAMPIYKKNEDDGSLVIDKDGQPVLDCDFNDAKKRIIAGDASGYFNWLSYGRPQNQLVDVPDTWSISINEIYNDAVLTLDPKRYGKKAANLRLSLLSKKHLFLREIVDFFPEKHDTSGEPVTLDKKKLYKYVELKDIGYGDYNFTEMRGWELPGRARHLAESGDIYFGSIWGSAVKWCYIPENENIVVVTNGCFRCRIKEGKEKYLTDLLAYLNTEGWGVQMRSLARGSDGLADICEDDAKNVVIPLLSDEVREELDDYVQKIKTGTLSINSKVKELLKDNKVDYYEPAKRPSHIVLV